MEHLPEPEAAAEEVAAVETSRGLGGMGKFLALILLALLMFWMVQFGPLKQVVDLESLRALFLRIAQEPWAPVVYVLSFAVGLSIALPASPFILVGGIIFGVWPGALMAWLGAVGGAGLAFLVGRTLGRPFVLQLMGPRFQKLDAAVAHHGFWAIFTMRLIPVVPFNLSNFAAGVTGVRFGSYLLATGLAMAPGLTITTYFAQALWEGTGREAAYGQLATATALMLAFSAVPWIYKAWKGAAARRASRK